MLLLLCAVLGFVFAKSFQPGQTLFLNDGPLGSLKSDAAKLPDSFKGVWQDLNWIGMNGASALPSLTFLKFWLLGPVGYTKFHAPIAMVFLGLCAWLAFRQLGFRPLVCLLGGLAASLNSDLLSNACWGLSSRPLALATAFLTIAVLVTGRGPRGWFGWLVKCGLAGLTVGLGVVDAADVGAIFSLFLAAFAFVYSLTEEGSPTVNAVKGIARVAVMAAFALLMSMQIITGLIQAKVLGSEGVGAQQAKRSWQQNYDLATQWSLPKMESLRVIIPGLYGYLMTTPDGGQYWGGVGRSPQWQPSFGPNGARHSGAGEYAGVLVVLLAGWALAQSFRKKGSLVYTPAERKMIWFWGAMAAVALLASFGRHAPFYRLIFSLPYFNTVRNPIKWLHPLHLSLLMLFGYGLHGLCKAYLERAVTKTASLSAQLKAWWSNPTPFEKKWTILSVLTGAAGLLSWLVYSSSGEVLMRHLKETGFSAPEAESIARFSAGEVGLFVVFLAASGGTLHTPDGCHPVFAPFASPAAI